jgi:hypothetical protein
LVAGEFIVHEVEEPEQVTELAMNVYDCVGVNVMNNLLAALSDTEGVNDRVYIAEARFT